MASAFNTVTKCCGHLGYSLKEGIPPTILSSATVKHRKTWLLTHGSWQSTDDVRGFPSSYDDSRVRQCARDFIDTNNNDNLFKDRGNGARQRFPNLPQDRDEIEDVVAQLIYLQAVKANSYQKQSNTESEEYQDVLSDLNHHARTTTVYTNWNETMRNGAGEDEVLSDHSDTDRDWTPETHRKKVPEMGLRRPHPNNDQNPPRKNSHIVTLQYAQAMPVESRPESSHTSKRGISAGEGLLSNASMHRFKKQKGNPSQMKEDTWFDHLGNTYPINTRNTQRSLDVEVEKEQVADATIPTSSEDLQELGSQTPGQQASSAPENAASLESASTIDHDEVSINVFQQSDNSSRPSNTSPAPEVAIIVSVPNSGLVPAAELHNDTISQTAVGQIDNSNSVNSSTHQALPSIAPPAPIVNIPDGSPSISPGQRPMTRTQPLAQPVNQTILKFIVEESLGTLNYVDPITFTAFARADVDEFFRLVCERREEHTSREDIETLYVSQEWGKRPAFRLSGSSQEAEWQQVREAVCHNFEFYKRRMEITGEPAKTLKSLIVLDLFSQETFV